MAFNIGAMAGKFYGTPPLTPITIGGEKVLATTVGEGFSAFGRTLFGDSAEGLKETMKGVGTDPAIKSPIANISDKISDLFIRGTIIILGMIFIVAALSMFKPGK